jgi:DNA-binding response OmpR family regulator
MRPAYPAARSSVAAPLGSVLCVDDDNVVQIMLRDVVRLAGGSHVAARTAEEAEGLLARQRFAVVLLDRRLPDSDGLLLIEAIRRKSDCPVIVLSEMDCARDRLLGLGLGATEYLGKPFSPAELSSRLRYLLRRRAGEPPMGHTQPFSVGRLVFSPLSRRLVAGAHDCFVPPAEARLLCLFLESPGEVLDRDRLTQAACHRDWSPGDRTVDVLIARLRKRLPEDAAEIVTVHRLGYLLDVKT